MKPEHEARRKIIREWRSLPKDIPPPDGIPSFISDIPAGVPDHLLCPKSCKARLA
jgi:hypothetical protein